MEDTTVTIITDIRTTAMAPMEPMDSLAIAKRKKKQGSELSDRVEPK